MAKREDKEYIIIKMEKYEGKWNNDKKDGFGIIIIMIVKDMRDIIKE